MKQILIWIVGYVASSLGFGVLFALYNLWRKRGRDDDDPDW